MEIYFEPSAAALTERQQVLAAFSRAGLAPAGEQDASMWVVAFADSVTYVSFQERDGALCFATLEQPMDEIDMGNRIFIALEEMGWRSDEESVG